MRKENLRIRHASAEDIPALTRVINAAFVVERPFIEGDRVDDQATAEYMQKGKFLIAEDAAGPLGCVFCEVREKRGYLGLLAVYPERQGAGLGRRLMDAAEEYFRSAGCEAVDLRVVSAREELPAFYRRFGYEEKGREAVLPQVPAKVPLQFIHMSKML
jgi:ribosomal protein S18 acetylase RimI-like enzyme